MAFNLFRFSGRAPFSDWSDMQLILGFSKKKPSREKHIPANQRGRIALCRSFATEPKIV